MLQRLLGWEITVLMAALQSPGRDNYGFPDPKKLQQLFITRVQPWRAISKFNTYLSLFRAKYCFCCFGSEL